MIDQILLHFVSTIFCNSLFFITDRYARFIASFVIFCVYFECVSAQFLVEVIIDHRPVIRCDATGANFGDDVMGFSFGPYAIGCAFPVVPTMACSEVEIPRFNQTACISNFALVPRGNCTFSEKAYYVQKQYSALIMFNDQGQAPIPMSGSKFAENISIPVVMVNYACMESLTGHYSPDNGFVVTLKASPGYYDLIKYLVPFVAIVGFCFVVLFISLVIRLCKERRRLAKKRLSRSNLKKIPTKKYKKGDREETCAICLDDFVEGDKLRVLPCNHAYHCKCIDPWLTKNRKVCPVCKRKVGPSSNDSSDSDSERASTSTPSLTRENEPLIRNEQPMATSSSAEFPYPTSSLASAPTRTNGVGSFSRAASLLNLSRLFRQTSEANSLPINRNEISSEAHSTAEPGQNGFGNSITNRLLLLRNGFSNNWRRLTGHNRDGTLPHSRLEDEDTVTTVTHEELDFEPNLTNSREWMSPQSNVSPADGTSLTTVCSNRQIVNIDIQPSL